MNKKFLRNTISLYNINASILTGIFSKNIPKNLRGMNLGYDLGSFKHKLFYIWNTVHLQYINGQEQNYIEYIRKTNQKDHTPEKFDWLIDHFDLNGNPIEIDYRDGNFVILDGLHRLAIDYYQKKIKINYVKNFNIKGADNFELKNIIDLSAYKDQILDKFKATKNSFFRTNGWGVSDSYPAGYHSLSSFELNVDGQRNCSLRVNKINQHINLNGKSILDFGCNTGGMLFNVDDPAFCYGIDFDRNAINAANFVKNKIYESGWQEFSRRFIFVRLDLDRIDFKKKFNSLNKYSFDVVLLGSLGSWIKNWKELYSMALMLAPDIIFEENNSTEGLEQINYFHSLGCNISLIISGSDDDLTGNNSRNTYLISRPVTSKS